MTWAADSAGTFDLLSSGLMRRRASSAPRNLWQDQASGRGEADFMVEP